MTDIQSIASIETAEIQEDEYTEKARRVYLDCDHTLTPSNFNLEELREFFKLINAKDGEQFHLKSIETEHSSNKYKKLNKRTGETVESKIQHRELIVTYPDFLVRTEEDFDKFKIYVQKNYMDRATIHLSVIKPLEGKAGRTIKENQNGESLFFFVEGDNEELSVQANRCIDTYQNAIIPSFRYFTGSKSIYDCYVLNERMSYQNYVPYMNGMLIAHQNNGHSVDMGLMDAARCIKLPGLQNQKTLELVTFKLPNGIPCDSLFSTLKDLEKPEDSTTKRDYSVTRIDNFRFKSVVAPIDPEKTKSKQIGRVKRSDFQPKVSKSTALLKLIHDEVFLPKLRELGVKDEITEDLDQATGYALQEATDWLFSAGESKANPVTFKGERWAFRITQSGELYQYLNGDEDPSPCWKMKAEDPYSPTNSTKTALMVSYVFDKGLPPVVRGSSTKTGSSIVQYLLDRENGFQRPLSPYTIHDELRVAGELLEEVGIGKERLVKFNQDYNSQTDHIHTYFSLLDSYATITDDGSQIIDLEELARVIDFDVCLNATYAYSRKTLFRLIRDFDDILLNLFAVYHKTRWQWKIQDDPSNRIIGNTFTDLNRSLPFSNTNRVTVSQIGIVKTFCHHPKAEFVMHSLPPVDRHLNGYRNGIYNLGTKEFIPNDEIEAKLGYLPNVNNFYDFEWDVTYTGREVLDEIISIYFPNVEHDCHKVVLEHIAIVTGAGKCNELGFMTCLIGDGNDCKTTLMQLIGATQGKLGEKGGQVYSLVGTGAFQRWVTDTKAAIYPSVNATLMMVDELNSAFTEDQAYDSLKGFLGSQGLKATTIDVKGVNQIAVVLRQGFWATSNGLFIKTDGQKKSFDRRFLAILMRSNVKFKVDTTVTDIVGDWQKQGKLNRLQQECSMLYGEQMKLDLIAMMNNRVNPYGEAKYVSKKIIFDHNDEALNRVIKEHFEVRDTDSDGRQVAIVRSELNQFLIEKLTIDELLSNVKHTAKSIANKIRQLQELEGVPVKEVGDNKDQSDYKVSILTDLDGNKIVGRFDKRIKVTYGIMPNKELREDKNSCQAYIATGNVIVYTV